MAVRTQDAAFVVPSVVHLKVEHFAAITRQEGDRYLLQDPTFGNDLWVTRDALEAETSGYFLIPHGELAPGWRAVDAQEGETVWGKGTTGDNEPGPHAPGDPASPGGGNSCPKGMAVSRVHLMLVSLNIIDEPLGYAPPVGPAVPFMVRYNQRDAGQTGDFAYSNFGHKWTFDWLSYIQSTLNSGDVSHYVMGGGTRKFRNFNPTTKSYPISAIRPDHAEPSVPRHLRNALSGRHHEDLWQIRRLRRHQAEDVSDQVDRPVRQCRLAGL